jgi:hypothetical protein
MNEFLGEEELKVIRIISIMFLREKIPYFLQSSRVKTPWKFLNYS